jgi:hypothetical protein
MKDKSSKRRVRPDPEDVRFEDCQLYSQPPYKRWGPVAELTCHIQGSTPYGITFSHETFRPLSTQNFT